MQRGCLFPGSRSNRQPEEAVPYTAQQYNSGKHAGIIRFPLEQTYPKQRGRSGNCTRVTINCAPRGVGCSCLAYSSDEPWDTPLGTFMGCPMAYIFNSWNSRWTYPYGVSHGQPFAMGYPIGAMKHQGPPHGVIHWVTPDISRGICHGLCFPMIRSKGCYPWVGPWQSPRQSPGGSSRAQPWAQPWEGPWAFGYPMCYYMGYPMATPITHGISHGHGICMPWRVVCVKRMVYKLVLLLRTLLLCGKISAGVC